MAESDGLENRCGLTPTVGSNPTPSAKHHPPTDWEVPGSERGRPKPSPFLSAGTVCGATCRLRADDMVLWRPQPSFAALSWPLAVRAPTPSPHATLTYGPTLRAPSGHFDNGSGNLLRVTTTALTSGRCQRRRRYPRPPPRQRQPSRAKSAPRWHAAIFAAETGGILSVSCPSVRLCIAVDTGGHAFVSTDPTGGRSAWKWVTVPGASSGFGAVSCPEVKLCVAIAQDNVLTTTDPTGGPSAWKSVDVGNALMGQAGDEFEALSCASASLCAVGDVNGNVLVSTDPTGAASTWKVVDADARASNAGISALSCPSAHFCVAGDDDGNILTTS